MASIVRPDAPCSAPSSNAAARIALLAASLRGRPTRRWSLFIVWTVYERSVRELVDYSVERRQTMVNFEDRKAAIVGGTSGIGLETARLLSERGAKVTVGSRDEGHLEEAQATLDGGARAIPVDATERDSLRRFFEAAGPIDDLVVTVTRRGGAGPAADLGEQDLTDAFVGKP